MVCMETYVPFLAVRHVERVMGDECVEISSLANDEYLHRVVVKHMEILYPIDADKKPIRDSWQQCWLNSMAGCGLEYMDREKMSTQWLSFPIFRGRDYCNLVKLMFQTLPCKGQRFCVDKMCHMGCQAQESAAHILQKCPATHYP